ncbi:MAG: cold shock domain-containing protein [Betaproteobacteria bacterium]
MRKPAPRSPAGSSRPVARQDAAAGRIVKILLGQGHGFIRLADGRQVFFHRADLEEGTTFNGLRVGDSVRFELLEDRVSGARALRVRRDQRTR